MSITKFSITSQELKVDCECYVIPPYIQKIIEMHNKQQNDNFALDNGNQPKSRNSKMSKETLEERADTKSSDFKAQKRLATSDLSNIEVRNANWGRNPNCTNLQKVLDFASLAPLSATTILSTTTIPSTTTILEKMINAYKAMRCYENMEIIDRFCQQFGVYPTGATQKMVSCFHCPGFYNNALWSSKTCCTHFGEIDNQVFSMFEENLDIMAHEFGHAIIQYYSPGLIYEGQSGAINESIADIFAIMVKHFHSGKLAENPRSISWGFAKVILDVKDDATKKKPLRSLKKPGRAYKHHIIRKDRQVNHMTKLNEINETDLREDWGGVHFYSGIPNHAFYLIATTIGDRIWDKAGKIWFQALTQVKNKDQFEDFAIHTVLAVASLKYDESISKIVKEAWKKVAINKNPRHAFIF